jgi:hypothetical protein
MSKSKRAECYLETFMRPRYDRNQPELFEFRQRLINRLQLAKQGGSSGRSRQ